MSNSDPRCKCPMSISMTGDGCRYCQPQEYIDRLEEWLGEAREEASSAGAVPEDGELIRLAHKAGLKDVTYSRFKDGIDVDEPKLELIRFANLLLTAAPTAPVESGGVPDEWFHALRDCLMAWNCEADEGDGIMEEHAEIHDKADALVGREMRRRGFLTEKDDHPHNGEQGDLICDDCGYAYGPTSCKCQKHIAGDGEQGDKRCSWWKDMADWDGNTWEADCGACWVFIDEGPVQNEMNYCPKCGRKLSQLPAPPTEREGE